MTRQELCEKLRKDGECRSCCTEKYVELCSKLGSCSA